MNRIARPLPLALLAFACAVSADALAIDRTRQQDTGAMPTRGMSMTQADAHYGAPSEKSDSRECELINLIIDGYYHAPTKVYAVRNYNPGGKISNHHMVNTALERHFDRSQIDAVFRQIFHSMPVRTSDFACNTPIEFVSEKKAAKISSKNRYDPRDYRHDLYTLHHSKEEYTAYYFSSPVYFGDYAAMKCTARRSRTDARYELFLMKRVNGKWQFLDILDAGIDESFQDAK
ncbi:hypothetical protein M2650_02830 [Luteimonas sp. SX5]|uniref:DUF3828 domain-containing protein n=1 Tax=Luteimonas galliterrae TaxID=2940486 RepID=A0ABT0MFE3_9GAMM|nr:hypothetical protein [Luteimonas galliterrae]MCL1633581.1 hypothetical protein [Luteimonas galliterrae]